MNRLCHSKFIAFVMTPPGLVDPDTASQAKYTQGDVRRKKLEVGARGQTEEDEQDADEHPESRD